MAYPRIADALYNQPWMIRAEAHRALAHAFERAVSGSGPAEVPRMDDRVPRVKARTFWGRSADEPYTMHRGNVARVECWGICGKHLDSFDMMCGGLSLDHTAQALEAAAADPSAEAVVLDISSPGGVATGVPELGRAVARAAEVKPVVAYSETECCSALYWIASQCTRVAMTPSARIGSVGVYVTWLDPTEALERSGVHRELFEAGKHKAIGLRPPTDEERAILKAKVEKLHAEFKAAVTGARPQVKADALEGLTYDGEEAVANGLADDLVEGWEELLDLMGVDKTP